jgi:hypothetical protein
MSDHSKALLPLESWGYHSPELRYSGKTLDLGLLSEGLIYYDSILLNITTPPQLAEFILWFQKQNKYYQLLSLFNDNTIQLYDYSFSSAAILKDGKYSIWNIQDQIQMKDHSFEERFLYHESLNGCFRNARERKQLYQVLRGKVKEAKSDQFSLSIENARMDFYDPDRARLMIQAFIDEIAPIMGWEKIPKIEVEIKSIGTDTTFTYNLNFDEISTKLGPEINFGIDTPLTAIAHCNRLIQTGLEEKCDLFLGSPMSSLVGNKLSEANSNKTGIHRILDSLNQEIEYPDLRLLVNNGKMSIQEILQIRKKAKRFRNWLQTETDRDRNAIIAYHTELAKESGLLGNTRKVLNIFGFISGATAESVIASHMGGVEGQVIGATVGGGIAYLANLSSKIGADWKPVVFGKWLEKKVEKY